MYDDPWNNPKERALDLWAYFGLSKAYDVLDDLYKQDPTMDEEWYTEILRWLDYFAER